MKSLLDFFFKKKGTGQEKRRQLSWRKIIFGKLAGKNRLRKNPRKSPREKEKVRRREAKNDS